MPLSLMHVRIEGEGETAMHERCVKSEALLPSRGVVKVVSIGLRHKENYVVCVSGHICEL